MCVFDCFHGCHPASSYSSVNSITDMGANIRALNPCVTALRRIFFFLVLLLPVFTDSQREPGDTQDLCLWIGGDDRSSAHCSSRNALGNGAKRPDDSSSKTNFFILHAVDLVSALSVSLSAALSSELSRVFSVTWWLSPKYISERMQTLSEGQGHFHIVPLFLSLFIFCECCSCSSSTRLRCQTDILLHKLGRR